MEDTSLAPTDKLGNQQKNDIKTVLGITVLLGSFAAFVGIQFFSKWLFAAELLNNFRLQISAIFLSVAIVFFLIKYRKLASLQTLLAIGLFAPLLTNYFASRTVSEIAPANQSIQLISYNVLGDNRDPQPVLDTVFSSESDILVIIEYENRWIDPLDELDRRYKYSIKQPRWHGFGVAVFSKEPIVEEQVHQLTEKMTDNPFIICEIETKSGKFLLCVAHFLAPMGPKRMEIRNRQMREAAELIANERKKKQLPVVLIGDFNCVAWSPHARQLMSTVALRDSREGYLYHGSWPTSNPLLSIPIDNAFVSDEITVHSRAILPADSSDHHPLCLEFSIDPN